MDECEVKILNSVIVQENGIIRNKQGYIIARLTEGIDFSSEHLKDDKEPVAKLQLQRGVMTRPTCEKCKRILENNWGDICGDCLKDDN